MSSTSTLSLRVLVVALCFGLGSAVPIQAEPVMYAHFINVGQADATLLEFPCGAILVDAGSQDDAYTDSLIQYLHEFFRRRTDLHNTLEAVLITHNHPDHTSALKAVVQQFTVLRYLDNGQLEGPGTANPKWVRSYAAQHPGALTVLEIADSDVTSVTRRTGLTNRDIDPVQCADCDPVIRVLSGRLDENPGWSQGDFDNKNNQSIVVRVDFGESSLLITGDLEEDAQATLVDWYSDTELLDVDVYHVGHHGSANGTTAGLLAAVTPEVAIISCGSWDFGKDSRSKMTTYAFGHPRVATLDLLAVALPGKRNQAIDVHAATGAREFTQYRVKRRIYATPWDGTVDLRATLDGQLRVTGN